MKVILASDHAGFELKEELEKFLASEGYEVEDIGPHSFNQDDDYPDFVIPGTEKVVQEGCMGIVLGASGQGEALAANKVKGARAVIYSGGPEEILRLSREHNNANILSLGAHFLDAEQAKKAVKLWLETPFSEEERHSRRLQKISGYEK